MRPLVVKGVTKRWHGKADKVGLENVCFKAMPGTLTAIVGPSGAGKTTLLKAIAGICPVDSGEIQRGKAQPVMVFQEDSLWPHMTLIDNVSSPLRLLDRLPRVEAERRATELLTEWGLAEELKRFPAQLSGGQRQRGALARAWLRNPEVLCLDEITSGLDPESTAAILRSILKLKATQTILLMVTHQMSFARAVADRALFLESGHVIDEGPARDVLSQPRQPRIQRFIEAFEFSGG